MNNTHTDFLQTVPSLMGYSKKFIKQVAECAQMVTYQKGDHLLRAGQLNQSVGFIAQGLVKAYGVMDNQEENFWAFYQEKDLCICPFSVLSGKHSQTNLLAIERTKVITMSLVDFNRLRKANPDFETSILKVISDRMMYLMKEKSLMLNMTAMERYQYFIQQYPDMLQRLPLGLVSTFLGIRQSSLSRIRRSMSRQSAQQA